MKRVSRFCTDEAKGMSGRVSEESVRALYLVSGMNIVAAAAVVAAADAVAVVVVVAATAAAAVAMMLLLQLRLYQFFLS